MAGWCAGRWEVVGTWRRADATVTVKLWSRLLRASREAVEKCIAYGMPGFRLEGKVIAGFAAFKNHLSYLPRSGSVLSELSDDLAGYARTPGSLHFSIDKPLPTALVRRLIAVRLRQIRRGD